jgi:hypothetical protein
MGQESLHHSVTVMGIPQIVKVIVVEMIPLTNVLYVMDPALLPHSAIVNNILVIVTEHAEVYYIMMSVMYVEDQELSQELVTVKEIM